MSLTLRLRQEDRHPAGQTSERQLDHGRLVLGRGAESDWVLIDSGRTISKRHCVIEKADLGYAITDLSANGVFINDEDEPVGVGNTRKVCSDGLYRSVADAEMADMLSRADCEEAAEALLALSLSRQPTDNVTLGVVQGADGELVSVTESLF